ncbi:histidine kinase-, DNA gyrase B-, and HSP90-like ATPase family protein [Anoxybacillus sp. B7M1]|jgi:two-component system, sensor histidine kinase YcbA|uniref:sensor histidine kinase n=1 Tax=unclassified Anoxybacillus TaxID=2639704 RepID=UPI0005CD04ED|nr:MULTISPECIES: sensor histidine kinase [unclassified Anoxybacillus]ANB59122.1 histidine kinase-, DNA gyrase B-, and HSP90-like ATPase family protein [Anoxybacillus sp. B2M1]ANB64460.1 histidine kinase-, DNA gyrase B-, and HSP90-like ATPase family protein [Anoxybacillus sp. B7M1]
MRERILTLLLLISATAFLGEMKVNPFSSSFRFSLGSVAFFFGLVWLRTIPLCLTGFCVGVFVTAFRVMIDWLTKQQPLADSLLIHLPAGIYYIFFAWLVYMTKFRQHLDHPIHVGVLGAAIDFTANIVELFIRQLLGESFTIAHETVFMLLLFAILRSFCVIGLYNILTIQHMRALGEARRQELERLVMINTSLYEEAFYLRKSMSHLEEITHKSYELYTQLMESKQAEPGTALYIAEHIHEVKKDSQRILAGLSDLISQEQAELNLPIKELCRMVIRTNKKYAELLGKSIHFHEACDIDLPTHHVYALLSVLNNLVANAVEAVPDSGWVSLHVQFEHNELVFRVTDSGPGIPDEDQDWIFQPGFTTKYDENGNPSNGIGLTHAQEIVHSFKGHIQLTFDEHNRTQFQVRIPGSQLLRKEEAV